MTSPTRQAPAIEAVQWFNTDTPPSLDALHGRVVVIEAFQMLCPGCVSHGLPQAAARSEEHTSELQSLMRTSYAVFCLKKKKQYNTTKHSKHTSERHKHKPKNQ